MALTPPTYGVGYLQAEQNSNAAAICSQVDAVNAQVAANMALAAAARAALHVWIMAIQMVFDQLQTGDKVATTEAHRVAYEAGIALIDATGT